VVLVGSGRLKQGLGKAVANEMSVERLKPGTSPKRCKTVRVRPCRTAE